MSLAENPEEAFDSEGVAQKTKTCVINMSYHQDK
jgi:hypothetical protein